MNGSGWLEFTDEFTLVGCFFLCKGLRIILSHKDFFTNQPVFHAMSQKGFQEFTDGMSSE